MKALWQAFLALAKLVLQVVTLHPSGGPTKAEQQGKKAAAEALNATPKTIPKTIPKTTPQQAAKAVLAEVLKVITLQPTAYHKSNLKSKKEN